MAISRSRYVDYPALRRIIANVSRAHIADLPRRATSIELPINSVVYGAGGLAVANLRHHPFRSPCPPSTVSTMPDGSSDVRAQPKDVRGFGSLFVRGLFRLNALGGTAVGAVFTWAIATMSAKPQVPAWVLSLVVTILFAALSLALLALLESINDAKELRALLVAEQNARAKDKEEFTKSRSAVVVAAEPPFAPYQSSKCVLIVDWSPQLALRPGTPVTIATAEPTHERPLGGGWVRPQQHDGRSVVTLDTPHSDAEQFVTALLNKTSHPQGLANIRIGPAADLQNISPSSSVPFSATTAPTTQSVKPGSEPR